MEEIYRANCPGYLKGKDEKSKVLFPILDRDRLQEATIVRDREGILNCICPYAQLVGADEDDIGLVECRIVGLTEKEKKSHPLVIKLISEGKIPENDTDLSYCQLLKSVAEGNIG